MDRLPKQLMIHVLEYLPVRQRFRLLRVNRTLNLFIRTNCAGLSARLGFMQCGLKNKRYYVIDFFCRDVEWFRFEMTDDTISFDVNTELDFRPTKLIDYLVWKTGSHIIKEEESIQIPVPNPLETFFMLFDLIMTKITSLALSIALGSDAVFREIIYDRIQRTGLEVKNIRYGGRIPIKELLHMNNIFHTASFCFYDGYGTQIISEEEKLLKEYNWKIDDLFPFQSTFSFCTFWNFELESWTSIETVLEDWKNGVLDNIAASIYTKKCTEIRNHLTGRLDVQDIGISYSHRELSNYAIVRDQDEKWLWIQLDGPFTIYGQMTFSYCTMSGDIRTDLLENKTKNRLSTYVECMYTMI